MLQFLDMILTIVHLAIVAFNLFGWIPVFTRKGHFISIVLTAVSWFVLGFFFGIGYCPFTDWHWQVKSALGETGLPASFIKYFADNLTGKHLSSSLVNTATAVFFFASALLSVYVNFILPVRKRNRRAAVR